MSHGRPPARGTTQCKVEKWEADSGEVLDAQTCVRTPALMFSLLFSLVSDNCHGHRATRHVMTPVRFRREGENDCTNIPPQCRTCQQYRPELRRTGGKRVVPPPFGLDFRSADQN